MKYYRTILTVILFAITTAIYAQEPVVGEPCPDFTLNNILDYSKKSASLEDFKGKWLILDFWTVGCTSCIASFPKINVQQQQYKDKVQFVLVGKDDKYIRRLHENVKKRYKLNIASTFDTVLFKQFDIGSVPYIVVIDPAGIVRAVTFRVESHDIADFLNGKTPVLKLVYGKTQGQLERSKEVTRDRPLLTGGNGGADTAFTYRSLIMPWKRSMGQKIPLSFNHKLTRNNGIFLVGANVEMLFQYAYGDTLEHPAWLPDDGKFSRTSIREVRDTSVFNHNWATDEGIYVYQLIFKNGVKKSSEELRRMFRNDLENYFGFRAKVETRMLPYWRLEATGKAIKNLETKGGKPLAQYDKDQTILVNQPVSKLILALMYTNPFAPPVIDETGITTKIDISYKAIAIDFQGIKDALLAQGLKLIRSERPMKAVVITDQN